MPVRCSSCNSDNPDGARFCNVCGSSIAQPRDESPEVAVAIRCINCGATNSSALKKCGSCGADLAASVKAAESLPPAAPPQSIRQCPGCGRQIDPAASVCAYCGVDLATGLPAKVVRKDERPLYAAYLMFGAGALGLFSVAYSFAFQELPVDLAQFEGLRECCGEVIAILAVVCIIGGYFAMKRKHFMLAIIGAIAGMMTVGLYVGFMMGLIALVLLAISQKEFES